MKEKNEINAQLNLPERWVKIEKIKKLNWCTKRKKDEAFRSLSLNIKKEVIPILIRNKYSKNFVL